MRLKHRCAVPLDPTLPTHQVIPPYIFRPGMKGPIMTTQTTRALQQLGRHIFEIPEEMHTLNGLTNLFWCWWRSLDRADKHPQADLAALIRMLLKQKGTHVLLRRRLRS